MLSVARDHCPPSLPTMDFDMEKAHAQQFLDANADQSSRGSDAVVVEYNSTPIKQDNGILSRLRNIEARMDKKLGIESQAIERE